MIKLTYDQIVDHDFKSAVHKMATTPTNNRAASRIAKVTKPIVKAVDQIEKEFTSELVDTYAEKDEKGKPKRKPNGSFVIPEEKAEEFKTAQADFGKREVEIDWSPLTFSDIEHVQLSPSEFDAINGTIFTEEEPVAEVKKLRR